MPTFDRDAGSKTTYQYLKMFLKKGLCGKVLGDNFLHEGALYPPPFCKWELGYSTETHIRSRHMGLVKDKWRRDIICVPEPSPYCHQICGFYKKITPIRKVIYYGHDLALSASGKGI